jgi:hypothetical protein
MSLAAIKRHIRVGTALQIVRHDHPPVIFAHETAEAIEKKKAAFLRMFEVRRVAVVQSNAIAFHTDEGKLSWHYWPKASNVRDTANGFEVPLDDSFTKLIAYEWR